MDGSSLSLVCQVPALRYYLFIRSMPAQGRTVSSTTAWWHSTRYKRTDSDCLDVPSFITAIPGHFLNLILIWKGMVDALSCHIIDETSLRRPFLYWMGMWPKFSVSPFVVLAHCEVPPTTSESLPSSIPVAQHTYPAYHLAYSLVHSPAHPLSSTPFVRCHGRH